MVFNSISSNNVLSHPSITTDFSSVGTKNKQPIKMDDLTERMYDNMITEELDKKMLNPQSMIKNANKIFDNAEKRNINKSLNFKL